jgi:hypothetical protein
MRRALISTFVILLAVTGAFAGALSNWFRYRLSLEATVTIVPLVAACIVLLVIIAVARRQATARAVGSAVAIAVAGMILAVVAHHQAFETWLPALSREHVESSGTAVLRAHGEDVSYRLELHNPFAASHSEVLVITRGNEVHRIPVRVFEGAVGGYVSPATPNDWIILEPTSNLDVYEFKTTSYLGAPRVFRLDLRRNDALPMASAPIRDPGPGTRDHF